MSQPEIRSASQTSHSNESGQNEKTSIKEFWGRASCGEELYLCGQQLRHYDKQSETRYALEPYILDFANFETAQGKRVLEIGVGLGADHERFARAGAELWGIDLTWRAIEHTVRRFAAASLKSHLIVADAEYLPFDDEMFDMVYSWGVIHHSPDTPKAVAEIWRVLKPDGNCRVMIYHTHSFVGYMLWFRHAFLTLRWRRTLADIYAVHLESPGTKAYSLEEARRLFGRFCEVEVRPVLTHGDLLSSAAGQRHRGVLLSVARFVWPRGLIKRFFPEHGLFLLVKGRKPASRYAP